MAMTRRLPLIVLLACLISDPARAVQSMGWTSVRALGMGNAHSAVATESDAIFYNPAMLMKTSGVHWTVMNPRVGVDNPANFALVGPLTNSSGNLGEAVNNLYGKNIWAGGGALSAVSVPYFGVAAYTNTEAGIFASNAANPRINTNYYFDYGGAVGMALPLVPQFLALGLTIRSINRTGTTSAIGPAVLGTGDMSTLASQFKSRGNGYGVDFGTVLTIPTPLVSPTIAFVYRDIGETAFSHDEGAGSPPSVHSEMLAGAALTVNVPLISITGAIDYRYIGQNVATGSNLGLGLEIGLPLLNIRGGMSQGYYTAGAGIDLGLISADLATWGVELGEYPGQAVDRRYMVQVTIQIGLDPWALFGGGGGSGGGGSDGKGGGGSQRRRLKQRR